MKSAENPFQDMKILLVEDSFESLNLTRNMLMEIGFTQVFTAKDGMEALDLLNAFDGEDFVDVILCDWNMPRVTGIDLLKQIRSCDPELPFVMITGTSDIDSVSEAKAHSVTAYIRKPFSKQDLEKKMKIVSRILHHRQQLN